jgi:RNA polymerase sigma-70 factor (ECF subfamily)
VTTSEDHAQRRALEELYVQHERALYNVAYRYVWNREDARDVVQNAFVRLWNKRARIDWPRAAGLAFRTVLGLAVNHRRGLVIRRAFGIGPARGAEDTVDDVAGADEHLDMARADAAVRASIDALPERLRSVLVMCTFTELDYAAIAAVLDIAPGTVASRRNEAVSRLRAAVARRAPVAPRTADEEQT